MFVDSSVHIDVIKGVKKTPLHIASVKGDIAKIRLLLDLGQKELHRRTQGTLHTSSLVKVTTHNYYRT